MASNYKILSAFSDSGADLYIPIEWDFDSVKDLSVIIVDDTGNAKCIDYWKWNSELKRVEIENTQGYKYWAAYVMRNEDSATVLQAVASMEVNAQNIIEQFKKTNRIIEQIQETSKTTLRSPDYIDTLLPNATKRAGKMLTFDEKGNPEVLYETAQITEPQEYFYTKKNEIEKIISDSKDDITNNVNSASAFAQSAEEYSLSASDYATNAQNQATIATQQASNASASAQSAEQSANTAQEILSNVSILSAKTGRFFFNGGTFQATQKQALGTTFSICRTLKIKWEDWESLADYRYFDGNNLGWGSNSTIGWGFAIVSHRLFFYYRAIESGATILGLSTEQTKSIINGNVHTLIVTAGNNIFSIYVDGILIKSQTATQEIIEIPEPSYTQQIRQITGEYSRIKQFNFDMSADDAPYTIEDYCTGIEEPPSLHNPSAEYHADYSYSDDVNLVQVKDNSGNNNHAFIYGSIMADKNKEPANITASVVFDKNAIAALPIISTNANIIQKNQLITLKLKASIASSFNLGTLTDATYYGVVNLEANEWKSITIESSLDSPLIVTPQSALPQKCEIKTILNYERII